MADEWYPPPMVLPGAVRLDDIWFRVDEIIVIRPREPASLGSHVYLRNGKEFYIEVQADDAAAMTWRESHGE